MIRNQTYLKCTMAGSTSSMMSTTPKEPNCEDVAKEMFVKGNIIYTVKLLTVSANLMFLIRA